MGVTPEYAAYLASSAWREKSRFVKQQWKDRCYVCGEWYKTKGFPLTVHHLTYRRLGHEAPGDLIPLCGRHHPRGACSLSTLRLMKLSFWAGRFVLWCLWLPIRCIVLVLSLVRQIRERGS